MSIRSPFVLRVSFLAAAVMLAFVFSFQSTLLKGQTPRDRNDDRDDPIVQNAARMIAEGKQTFRFDTFGDEQFWGDTLQLHRAIAGSELGGVGPGLTPRN